MQHCLNMAEVTVKVAECAQFLDMLIFLSHLFQKLKPFSPPLHKTLVPHSIQTDFIFLQGHTPQLCH